MLISIHSYRNIVCLSVSSLLINRGHGKNYGRPKTSWRDIIQLSNGIMLAAFKSLFSISITKYVDLAVGLAQESIYFRYSLFLQFEVNSWNTKLTCVDSIDIKPYSYYNFGQKFYASNVLVCMSVSSSLTNRGHRKKYWRLKKFWRNLIKRSSNWIRCAFHCYLSHLLRQNVHIAFHIAHVQYISILYFCSLDRLIENYVIRC